MLLVAADDVAIHLASRILDQGGLVAIPTETVYGLAAAINHPNAVNRIFTVKGRPKSHPLIVHVPNTIAARRYASFFPPAAEKLAAAFWPGPLTLIVPRSTAVPDCVTGGHPTVGLRVPAHPLTLKLLQELGHGLAAPSANRFTEVSPTRASHVATDLGNELDLILDGGPCSVGVESTVIDLSGNSPVLLRPGGISREALERVLETTVLNPAEAEQVAPSPGQHPLHYSPRATVQIVDRKLIWSEARNLSKSGKKTRVFAFQSPVAQQTAEDNLDVWIMPADLNQLAQELYSRLRQADQDAIDVLVVELPTSSGMGQAIRDRILRAAGKS